MTRRLTQDNRWPDALTSDFAKAISEHRESLPTEIWAYIDKLQREVDYSRGGKLGPPDFERQVFRLLSGGSEGVRTLVHGMMDAGWSAKKIVGFFLFHAGEA